MKSILGEYGKLIILIIAAVGIITYFFGTGFITRLEVMKPKETLKAVSQADRISVQQDEVKPTLTVKTEKLKVGECYDLLSFCTEAYGQESKRYPVKIVQIITPEGKDLTADEEPYDPGKFIPEEKGVYEVVYRAAQWYTGGYPVQIEKTFRYLAV